jgi:hypothetical protein
MDGLRSAQIEKVLQAPSGVLPIKEPCTQTFPRMKNTLKNQKDASLSAGVISWELALGLREHSATERDFHIFTLYLCII